MMELPQVNPDSLRSICDLTESQLAIAYSPAEEDDFEEEWGQEDDDGNAFDAFDDIVDE